MASMVDIKHSTLKDRVLIVGGTGFIGAHLARICHQLKFRCYVLSLNEPSYKNYVEGISYLYADLADSAQVKKVLQDYSFEYVVNLSGYINHSSLFNGGRTVIAAHFEGLLNLLQALDCSVLKGFVQVGSSDEYGNLPAPQQEIMREAPISPYSVAKTASTHLMQMLHKTEGFPATIVRLFLVYGEGQDDKRFLPQVIQGCLEDQEFNVSAGEQIRDFCHVNDISHGLISAMISDATRGEVINLASGQPVTIRKTIEMVQAIIGKGKPVFGKIAYRQGENMELYASVEKASKYLHWKPSISFDDGLRSTINYYVQKIRQGM